MTEDVSTRHPRAPEQEEQVQDLSRVGLLGDSTDSPTASAVAPDTNDRRTPLWFFEACERRYGLFDVDVAASLVNTLVDRYFSETQSALTADRWFAEQAWCNPPYGPGGTIDKWIAKARHERDKWATRTLILLPADTSTRWYHDVSRTELIELVPFRLKFDGPDGVQQNTAKFGSVLVWIAPKIQRPRHERRTV